MVKSYLFRLIRMSVLIISFCTASVFAQKTPQKVIILHTNDMHAKIDNLAKLAYLKDSLLQTNPLVFLVSAGDNFTGNPVVDMIQDKGYPMIDLMNDCRFDASAIGNHEFDLGQDFMNKRFSQAKFRFICCNLDVYQSKLKQPFPLILLSKGDSIRLPVIGILQLGKNGLPDSHPAKMEGCKFVNGIDKAKDYIPFKEKYGNLIALTHLGIDDDIRLADSVPQIDVIIGGHSHTLLDKPRIEKGVMITQAGSNLQWVGKITLTLLQGKIIDKKDELIPMAALKSEKLYIRAKIDKYNDNEEFNKVLGEAVNPITGYSELGSLMTDAVRDAVKADIVFQNRGGIRIDSLAKGAVRVKDIYKLDPFANQVALCKMTVDEIQGMICNAYNMNKRIDLEVSGIKYTVFTDSDRKCIKVGLVPENSQEPLKTEYLVGMNSYIASAYSFPHQNDFQISDAITSQLLIDYLIKKKSIDYKGVSRTAVSNIK